MTNQQIIDFIKRSKQSGMEDNTIRQALLGSGFSVQDIEDSFQSMRPIGLPSDDNQSAQKSGSSSNLPKRLLKIFAIVILAAIVVIGGYFILNNYFPQYAKYVQPYLGPVLDPIIDMMPLGGSTPSGSVSPTSAPVPISSPAFTPISNPAPTSTPVPTYMPQPTQQPPMANTDTDMDGLSDSDELKYGTDPNKPDTDGDGFPDGEEVQNGYNPLGPGRASPSPSPSPAS